MHGPFHRHCNSKALSRTANKEQDKFCPGHIARHGRLFKGIIGRKKYHYLLKRQVIFDRGNWRIFRMTMQSKANAFSTASGIRAGLELLRAACRRVWWTWKRSEAGAEKGTPRWARIGERVVTRPRALMGHGVTSRRTHRVCMQHSTTIVPGRQQALDTLVDQPQHKRLPVQQRASREVAHSQRGERRLSS